MEKADKLRFIDDLIANMKASVVAAVDAMPEDWDGHEIRKYIADKCIGNVTAMTPRRLREYHNTVAVTMGL
jgi:hypothetical protein